MNIPVKEVNLTVAKAPQQTFRSYGFYLAGMGKSLMQMKQETKDKIAKMMFEDLQMRLLHAIIGIPQDHTVDIEDTAALDAWIEKEIVQACGIGSGSPIDYMEKYGAELAVCCCGVPMDWLGEVENKVDFLNANNRSLGAISGQYDMSWLPGEKLRPLKEECVEIYVRTCVAVIKRLIFRWNVPIRYVATYDEPNFGRVLPETMCHIHQELRKQLDEAGLQQVKINGAEVAGINFAYTDAMRKMNPEAYALMQAVTLHGFGTGYMNAEYAEKAKNCGHEVWINSSGPDPRFSLTDLPLDENGKRYYDTMLSGVKTVGAIMVDINLYVSYMAMWLGLFEVNPDHACKKDARVDAWYHFFSIDPSERFLGADLMIAPEYDYIRTLIRAIEPECVMRRCTSSEEGDMSERFNLMNDMKNQMAACAGYNADGTFGFAVLNKTDSATRRAEIAAMEDVTEGTTLVQPSVKLKVFVEIEDLSGAGKKYFAVYRMGKNGCMEESNEILEVQNGKACIEIMPFELLAFREMKESK